MRIIAFSGRAGSGKSTSCNYLGGLLLTAFHRIDDFMLTNSGKLIVGGHEVSLNEIEPSLVKVYSFATALKEFAVNVLGLRPEDVYGSTKDKNTTLTHLLWEDMPGCISNKTMYNWMVEASAHKADVNVHWRGPRNFFHHAPGPMTVREVLQHFGTEVVRKLYDPAWVNSCISKIKNEHPMYVLVDDLRFPNEYDALKGEGAYCVRLRRNEGAPTESRTETALDGLPPEAWDVLVDNADTTIPEFKERLLAGVRSKNLLKPEPIL